MPNDSDAPRWRDQWAEILRLAREAGRDPASLVGSMYVTAAVDEDPRRADDSLNAYLEQYYGVPGASVRKRQACYAGPAAGLAVWLKSYMDAGVDHLIVRCAGDHERHLDILAAIRSKLI